MPGQEKIIDSEQQFKQPFVKFSQIVFFLLLAAAHNVAVLPAILLAVRILGMGGKNLRDKLLSLADQLRLLAESILDAQPVRTARPATRRKKTADCIRCSRHLPIRARGACDACYQRISLDISQGKDKKKKTQENLAFSHTSANIPDMRTMRVFTGKLQVFAKATQDAT